MNVDNFEKYRTLQDTYEKTWMPKVHIYKKTESTLSEEIFLVRKDSNGRAHFRLRKSLKITISCDMDIKNYPFDVQNCSNVWRSRRHTIEVNLLKVQCARAKRGNFLKSSPAFMVTFSVKTFSMT